jgi:signal recognition particle subunit SRP72
LVPNDAVALQTKLFLLLQIDQYASALEVLGTSLGDSSISQQPSNYFERAYVLYRLHREQEAQDLLASMSDSSDRGVQHLDAQLVS